jgi:hypothetical protein
MGAVGEQLGTSPVAQFIVPCAPQVRLFPSIQVSDPSWPCAADTYWPCSVDTWYLPQVQLVVPPSAPIGPPVPASALPTSSGGVTPFLQMPNTSSWGPNQPIRCGNLAGATSYVHVRPFGETNLYDLQYWLFYAVRGLSTARFQVGGQDLSVDLEVPGGASCSGLPGNR